LLLFSLILRGFFTFFTVPPLAERELLLLVFDYKMENKRNGCINRDKNGCKNIQKVFNYYIEYDELPERYKRGVELQKLQTAIVLSNCS